MVERRKNSIDTCFKLKNSIKLKNDMCLCKFIHIFAELVKGTLYIS